MLEGVSRRFGPVTAVDSIDLTVADNEFVTLLGPSGCGKTTTLRMVAGLEQNDEGRISIGGKVVSDAGKRLFVPPDKRALGMVFQSYAIWPHLSVFDNVAYPLQVRKLPTAQVRERVTLALRLVEMEAYADRPAPLLSGGQQQRVAIARALSFDPQVLLLDEPLSNLDSRLRASTGDELRALQQRLKITTLYVTHDQDEAMALSDRVVVMQQGKILQIGRPESIYQRPATRAVAAFFGTPNLFPVKVLSSRQSEANTHALAIEGAGGWRGHCLAGEAFEPGEDALVMTRAEDMVLVDADAQPNATRNAWRGTVVASIFRGARRSMVVECAGTRVNIDAPAMRTAEVGDNVTLVAESRSSWALKSREQ